MTKRQVSSKPQPGNVLTRPTEYAKRLAEHADAIRAHRKLTVESIIEIGKHLTAAKKLAGHGNWLPWLSDNFGWSANTALRFMNVAANPPSLANLNVPISSVYQLAAPKTPDTARDAIAKKAAKGKVKHQEVVQTIRKAKPKPEPDEGDEDDGPGETPEEREERLARGKRWREAATRAWIEDHSGHTAADFNHWSGCGATDAEAEHWEDWHAKFEPQWLKGEAARTDAPQYIKDAATAANKTKTEAKKTAKAKPDEAKPDFRYFGEWIEGEAKHIMRADKWKGVVKHKAQMPAVYRNQVVDCLKTLADQVNDKIAEFEVVPTKH